MSEVVCRGCGSTQPAGAPFCALCGREFPRTGRPPADGPGEPARIVHTGTTENEVVSETWIPASAPVPPDRPAPPPYAHVGRRVVGYLVDSLAVGLVAAVVYGVGFLILDWPTGHFTPADPEFALIVGRLTVLVACAGAAAFLYGLGMLVWEGRTGRTVGNVVTGIRTVGEDDGAPIGFGRALLRWLVVWLVSLVPVVGLAVVLLSPLWDAGGRRQGWHDRAARAVVVRVRRESSRPAAPAVEAPADPRPTAWSAAPVPGPAPAGAPTPEPTPGPALSPERAPTPQPGPAPEPEPTPQPEPAPEPGPAPAPRREPTPPPAQPAPSSAVVLELELESGERIRLDGPARIGRNPAAAPHEKVRLIRVDDPTRSVSKNHADLDLDPAGLWVVDRGSTNGTVVAAAGQPPRVAEQGARVRVPVGATIHVGDRHLTVHQEPAP